MKRMRVFIILIIAIFLIVTVGRLSFADEFELITIDINKLLTEGVNPEKMNIKNPNYFFDYDGDGDVDEVDFDMDVNPGEMYLNSTMLHQSTNMQCIERGKTFKRGIFKVNTKIKITGDQVTITYYGKGDKPEYWNYPKPTSVSSGNVASENSLLEESEITMTVKESNVLAAILTTDNFSHGYYLDDDDKRSGNRADSQLAMWYYWNTWAGAVKDEISEQNLPKGWNNVIQDFPTNELEIYDGGLVSEKLYYGGRAIVEQGVFIKNDEGKYIWNNNTHKYEIPQNGKYPSGAQRYVKESEGARRLAEFHQYTTTIYIMQFCRPQNTNKNAASQTVIVYEPEPSIKQLTIEKEWDDDDDIFETRPKSIDVEIKAYAKNEKTGAYEYTDVCVYKENKDGVLAIDNDGNYILENKGPSYVIQLSAENDWKDKIYVLAKNSNLIYYSIKEVKVDNYELDKNATVGTTGIEKIVDKDKIIKYKLGRELSKGSYIADDELMCTNWSAYITLVNKLKEIVEINVSKQWDDIDDIAKIRPDSIIVKLLANGKETGKLLTLNENNNWSGTFGLLDKYKKNTDGTWTEINYTVVENEITIDGTVKYQTEYTSSVTPETENTPQETIFTITNTYVPTEVNVVKKWQDMEDLDEYRPDSITVKLLANGQETGKSLILNENNNWSGKFGFLDKYKKNTDGTWTEITYTIAENTIEKYQMSCTPTITQQTETYPQVTTFTITNTHQPHYDGYIEINGKVWLDGTPGKGNDINGTLGEEDTKLSGIKVRLKDKDGNEIRSTYTDQYKNSLRTDYAVTKDDGTYSIRVNYDNRSNVYKLYEDIETVREKIKTAYVEFEYDGMLYTTVATAESGENTSKAKENEEIRNRIDSVHSTTLSETKHPNEWTDKNITASTQNVISFANYEYKTTTTRSEVLKYCDGNGKYIRTNPEGAWKEIKTGIKKLACTSGKGHDLAKGDVEVQQIQNVNLGLFKREQPNVSISSDLSKVEVTMQGQKYTYLYNVVSNGNEEDVELKAQFQSNGYYTYRRPVNPADIAYINEKVNVDKELLEVYVTYKVIVENKSYTMPITVNSIINTYDTDYTIESIVKGEENPQNVSFTTLNGGNPIGENELDYKQAILNDLNITVRHDEDEAKASDIIYIKYKVSQDEIKDLLNDESSLHNGVEINSYTTKYGETTLYAEQRKGERTNKPYGGYDYDSHPGNAGMKKHTTTYTYTENGETKTFEGVEILKPDVPEDDTSIAPSFILHKDEQNKVLSGNIWEDTDCNPDDKERIGNGKNDEGKKVENVKVELLKEVVNEDGNIIYIPAKLYKINEGESGAEPIDIPAVTYTNTDGYYSFGNNGEDERNRLGVVTDRYKIRFTYGDKIEKEDGSTIATQIEDIKVNGRNYKSTIISDAEQNKVLYELFKNDLNKEHNEEHNYQWHLNTPDGYSIAVDDIKERVKIEDLQYSNFDGAINMIAESKPFEMQVEFNFNTEKTSSVGANGDTGFGNELNVFDFGIIERAKEDLFVEKTIDNITITLSNGQKLINGNPSEQNYVKAVGFKEQIDSSTEARKAIDKQLYAEIDAELIQGAQLEIRYAIKVTNNSEIDYDYYISDEPIKEDAEYDESKVRREYYYFGTNTGVFGEQKSRQITGSVNELIDYVSPNIEITWENPDNWERIQNPNDFKNKLINEDAAKLIKNGTYVAYKTTQFNKVAPGENKTDYVHAQRTLSYSEENVFDNHIEILEIDSKIARTIKGRDIGRDGKIGEIQPKESKPGNYIPSMGQRQLSENGIADEIPGMHEQDDNRVKMIITAPTGVSNYIIPYIVVILLGLVAMVVSVIFIKKKILQR